MKPREYFYSEVFRLPPVRGRPDHYTLLGLNYFEEDRDAILRAVLDRQALLDACEADPRPAYRKVLEQLRAEVRDAQLTLLDEDRRAAYDATLIGAEERAERGDDDEELELPPGTMFAERYRIMTEVRRGALGVVYEAMDRNLRTRVHLSVLRPKLSLDKRKRRPVENAARTMALVDHPNLVEADEFGDSGGLLFLRTRAVDGRNLAEAVSATPHGRFEPAEARRVAHDIADALAHLHAKGASHGDLRPSTVTLDATGRVLVTDTAVARAVADAGGKDPTPYREPEDEASPAGDAFALGALLYRMLAGEPPFPSGARKHARKPLPGHVPADLAQLTLRLLAPEPDQRPTAAVARDLLAKPSGRRPRALVLAAAGAAVVLVVALAALLALGGGDDGGPARAGVTERAYRMIVQRRYDDAIALLERARAGDPADEGLAAPLATALERKAESLQEAGDAAAAQVLLERAREVEPTPARARAADRARRAARERLAAVRVGLEDATAEPALRLRNRAQGIAVRLLAPEGKDGDASGTPDLSGLAEGTHEVVLLLGDSAGNERRVTRTVRVDRTPPEVSIETPEEGAVLRDGEVRVVVRVADENPPESVAVRGRPVALADGRAQDVFRLADGAHEIDVVVRDAAGHEARASRRVVVDTRGPRLELARGRIVTRDGRVVVRGAARGQVERVTVGGEPVEPGEDGAFEHALRAPAGPLAVVATGPAGRERRHTIAIVHDADPPEVAVRWERRDARGVLLYGGREMDRGVLVLPLEVRDDTEVSFEAVDGRVDAGRWRLPAAGERATARLVARDEAGNEAGLVVTTEGRRARPRLEVRAPAGTHWNDRDVVLHVDADDALFVQGRPAEPGRVELTLAEGAHELSVRVRDRWGNETAWTRQVVIDETPPGIELVGEPERGIGTQVVELEADEPLAEILCFAKSWPVEGRRVRLEVDLKPGRTQLAVRARDLAGNVANVQLPLVVRNRVLVLDGRGALRVDLPEDLELDEFTIECWVRGVPPQGTRGIVSHYRESGFALMWSGGRSRVPYAVVSGEKSGRVAVQVEDAWTWTEWVHLALCVSGRRLRFYVDGSLQQSIGFDERWKRGGGPLWIGADAGAGKYKHPFVGAIDEVRLSDHARYRRGFRPKTYLRVDRHTVFLHRFDRRDGKRLIDESERGLHAVVTGSVDIRPEER